MTAEEMRAAAIEAAEYAIFNYTHDLDTRAAATALIDSIAPLLHAPPRVKLLVWRELGETLLSGDYRIALSYGQRPGEYLMSRGPYVLGWYHSPEPAKAAAQTDHERRVLAALEGGE